MCRGKPTGNSASGPVGEYLEVVDYDPASRCFYHAGRSDPPAARGAGRLPPTESDPQFHQQMVYAVAMATIATFEKALGRVGAVGAAAGARRATASWSRRSARSSTSRGCGSTRTPCARRTPTTTRTGTPCSSATSRRASSPAARRCRAGPSSPACRSTSSPTRSTHALLHGLHRYFLYPSNPDVFAFHEAFADAVALFQHFSHPEVVRHQIARTPRRPRKREPARPARPAVRPGAGQHGARGALGEYSRRASRDPTAATRRPTSRTTAGRSSMAALFRRVPEHLREPRRRTCYRIATGGTGMLARRRHPPGPREPPGGRGGEVGRRTSSHVRPRASTTSPGGPHLRRVPAGPDHGRLRPRPRRRPRLPGRRSSTPSAAGASTRADVNVLDESAALAASAGYGRARRSAASSRSCDSRDWTLRADRRAVFLQMQENESAGSASGCTRTPRLTGRRGRIARACASSASSYQSIPRNKQRQPEVRGPFAPPLQPHRAGRSAAARPRRRDRPAPRRLPRSETQK